MSFAHPELLWTLPVALLLWVRAWRRKKPSLGFSSTGLLQGFDQSPRLRWRRLPEVLRGLAVIALLIGAASPQISTSRELQIRRGVAIELLVDVSSSMNMSVAGNDGQQLTRLQAVKQVLEVFIAGNGEELKGRPDDLLGLVSFARYADTACPLTYAHDALIDIVRHLEIEERPNEDGTAYGDAVALAAARLKHIDQLAQDDTPAARVKSRVIVLLTDGENNCGRHLPLEATALAKAWGIRIYVISLANDLFDETLERSGQHFQVASGPSPAEQILERMAMETGGIFRSAENLDALHSVYQEIDTLETSEIETEGYADFDPLFPFFAIFALLVLSAETILSATVLRQTP